MDELNQNNLTPKEQYDLKKKERDEERGREKVKDKVKAAPKKIGKYVFYILIVVAVIGGIVWLASLVPNLPPTSAQNHSEDSPPAHILTAGIPVSTQSHMLEHADGGGAPGIIIQYNCADYECEEDLVERLTVLVGEYPDNVYLAPNDYDGKIILTRLGKLKVLDEFDQEAIKDFITDAE